MPADRRIIVRLMTEGYRDPDLQGEFVPGEFVDYPMWASRRDQSLTDIATEGGTRDQGRRNWRIRWNSLIASTPTGPSSVAPWHGCERFHSQPDGARPQLTRHPPNRTSPQTRASPVREHLSPRPLPAISPYPTSPDGHKVSPRRLKTDTGPIYPNRARTIASLCPSSPILLLQRHTFGGFGLTKRRVQGPWVPCEEFQGLTPRSVPLGML